MLHRSFKPAKCKTSLKLATSRLKLLKNKKDAQLKQMKRELAQLLEAGQEQSARIRVEHVVREEKTMAAYDLLEIYCELIAARLPIIESQKNCPIDLKEAIASVVFATPRCADIPELQDVRKHFTAKYGKEFISAATELRPQCGVSRLLVEKLSANAPDGPTKIKILSAIAEEHNIKWDSESFAETELKAHVDLLNGPNTFEKASRMQTEPSIVQPPPSNVQAPPTPEQRPNAPGNFEHNARRPSTSSENFASEDGAQAPMPTHHHPGVRPSGTKSEMMDVRHSYSGDGNSFPTDRKHWNMEFKDATAAAQAAAESAERASMAARAAAELSIRAQYSSESHKPNIPSSRDEGPTKNDHNNPDEDIDKLMKDFLKGARYSQTSSLEEKAVKAERSSGFSGNNLKKESIGPDVSSGHSGTQTDSFNYFAEESIKKQNSTVSSHSRTKGDAHSQYSSEEAEKGETSTGFSGMNMNEQSIGSGAEFFSSGQGGMESNSFNYFAEESTWKKSSSVSSHSHSSSRGDDYDVSPFSNPKYETDGGEDPFHHENVHRDTAETSSYSNTAVVFDEPVSDDDHDNIFDTPNYAMRQFELYPTHPVGESPSHLQFTTDTWSPRQSMSGAFEKLPSHVSVEGHSPPKFDESSSKSAKPDEFSPLTFDESEGPSSESEDEVDNFRLDRKTDPGTLPQKENIFFRTPDHSLRDSRGLTGSFLTEKGNSVSDRKEDLTYSSDDEWVQVNKQGTEFSAQAQSKFGFDHKPIHQSSVKLAESQVISNDMTSEPFDNQAEERKNHQFAQTSKLSLDNEVKASNNTFTPKSSNNMKDNELLRQSSLESGNGLKFGKLTGGLRHKGYPPPPYSKSPSGDASSFKQAAEDSVTSIENSPSIPSVKSSVKSGVRAKVENKSSLVTPISDSDSDSDEFKEELLQRNLSSRKEPYRPKSSKEAENKLRLSSPATFFDSEDNDSEEDIPQQTFNSTGRVGSGFSRRTKATPTSGRGSRPKATVGSEASEPNSEADARKTRSISSHDSETPLNLRSQTGKSVHRKTPEPREEKQSTSRPKSESGNSRSSYLSETPTNASYRTEYSSNLGRSSPEPRAAKQSSSMPMPEYSNSMRQGNLKSSPFEPPSNRAGNVQSSEKQAASKPKPESNFSTRKDNLASSAMEQPSSPLRTVTSAGTESPKSSASSGELPSRESSLKKASHVHPKLPDYDTIAAQLQSLRSNR